MDTTMRRAVVALGVATALLTATVVALGATSAQQAGVDPGFILQLFQDVTGHKWMPLAILVIGYVSTLVSDTSRMPFNIPDRWKPVFVVVLGQAYGALQAIGSGAQVWPTVYHGLVTAFVTMGLFDFVVKAVFNGDLPKWLAWLALIDPNLAQAKKAGMLPPQPVFGKPKMPAVVPASSPATN